MLISNNFEQVHESFLPYVRYVLAQSIQNNSKWINRKFNFIPTVFDIDKFGKIRPPHLKERLKITKIPSLKVIC